ncbi:carbon-nitrogen hydrolase family protein [Nocardioides immobilis]|uniref:Carbon-nitrogen hydrolase family protein n=1 Tax=Nocardioides immobilis TaxID=2049295 RepID=A0A417Y0F5_9ACTN|nr:carbon-nitrogen hydrolase family protein [Nocardioides immobilis]RHW26054.1 carbon-nitrogen hydrolase family protein [Nocardioides immobilis]
MRVAAVQTATILADVDANLAGCERQASEAAQEGAEWILLPEFFTTGVAFKPELVDCALPPDGAATQLLLGVAKRHDVTIGGSFLCLDDDGHVRNAFFLATSDGIVGRHDKDIPSAWENCFYVGGTDDGILDVDGLPVGVALCLEYNRTQTVRRLRGKVDLVVGGSNKWGAPKGSPAYLHRGAERLCEWVPPFARQMGCPVVDANHTGPLRFKMPMVGLPYITELQGGSIICDARGDTLAYRHRDQGAGIVVADVEPGRIEPVDPIPDRFWINEMDVVTRNLSWRLPNWHGKRWYDRHGQGARRRTPSARENA